MWPALLGRIHWVRCIIHFHGVFFRIPCGRERLMCAARKPSLCVMRSAVTPVRMSVHHHLLVLRPVKEAAGSCWGGVATALIFCWQSTSVVIGAMLIEPMPRRRCFDQGDQSFRDVARLKNFTAWCSMVHGFPVVRHFGSAFAGAAFDRLVPAAPLLSQSCSGVYSLPRHFLVNIQTEIWL
jgi:hypothetical protein